MSRLWKLTTYLEDEQLVEIIRGDTPLAGMLRRIRHRYESEGLKLTAKTSRHLLELAKADDYEGFRASWNTVNMFTFDLEELNHEDLEVELDLEVLEEIAS